MGAVAQGLHAQPEMNVLIDTMKRELRKWQRSTTVYGTVNVVFRLVLIICSAIVAAEKSLTGSFSELAVAVPVLALIVSILTAIDTWIKPRDKWRGFMGDRDDLDNLLIRAQSGPQDSSTIDKLRDDFGLLRQRHREKNVY